MDEIRKMTMDISMEDLKEMLSKYKDNDKLLLLLFLHYGNLQRENGYKQGEHEAYGIDPDNNFH